MKILSNTTRALRNGVKSQTLTIKNKNKTPMNEAEVKEVVKKIKKIYP